MTASVEIAEIASAWRDRLGLRDTGRTSALEGAAAVAAAIGDRIEISIEAMMRLAVDDHRAEPALVAAIASMARDSRQGVETLAGSNALSNRHLAAFEAVVAFDGTRPAFLIRNDRVDFASTFSTSQWKTTLSPRLEPLAKVAACVGRVEIGERAIGTAFLVTPTLALTNRHVAQVFAEFGNGGTALRHEAFVDFGREDGGRDSFDRRQVINVTFAGRQTVNSVIDHGKLDVALIGLTASILHGEVADRALPLDVVSPATPGAIVAVIGYPGDWRRWVPGLTNDSHSRVLATLLAGKSGAKRLAPGAFADGSAIGKMTACHDATTINGNSGSPLLILGDTQPFRSAGLHYGGCWGGARTNWAHLFSLCRDMPVTGGKAFCGALQALGVTD